MPRRFLISFIATLSCCCHLDLQAEDGPWPQWRGPNRDDLVTETGLLQDWPEGGPKKIWEFTDCGLGYAGPAIVGSRMYIMGSRNGEEMLLCLDATNGKEIWASPLGKEFDNGWGNGPRSTPTVEGDRVYTVGGEGNLCCFKTEDGAEVWSKPMQELGGKIPAWGYSESPIIHEEKVLFTPGGEKGAIVALNKMTGELIWQAEELTDEAHYSSIMIKEHGGKTMGVQLMVHEVVGFDVDTGDVLWTVPWPGRVAVIPTPIFWEDCVYVTAGYGAGCKLVRVSEDFVAEEVYDSKIMVNHHGGVILLDDHIYGYSDGKGWVCHEIETGKRVWLERDIHDKGAIAYADGRFYCLSEDTGEIILIAASSDGWKEHGRFTIDPQSELRKPKGKIWVHPVIADGRLYLRDQELLYCYDVRAE